MIPLARRNPKGGVFNYNYKFNIIQSKYHKQKKSIFQNVNRENYKLIYRITIRLNPKTLL